MERQKCDPKMPLKGSPKFEYAVSDSPNTSQPPIPAGHATGLTASVAVRGGTRAPRRGRVCVAVVVLLVLRRCAGGVGASSPARRRECLWLRCVSLL